MSCKYAATHDNKYYAGLLGANAAESTLTDSLSKSEQDTIMS